MKNKVLAISLALTFAISLLFLAHYKEESELKDLSILNLKNEIELKSTEITELEVVIHVKDEDIKEKQKVIESREEIIRDNISSIESKNQEIVNFKNTINTLKVEAKKKVIEDKKPSVASRGDKYTGSKDTFVVQATAYTAYCAGCSGITRTGIDLRKNPNSKVIAVDPKVIPLGSLVEVTSIDYPSVNGVYVAGDTGGAIKSKRIDIFIQSKSVAYDFGRRDVKVKIIKKGE